MKAVLLSIQPKWCELIASEKKTVEVRKTRPKLETPFKVYIYCSDSSKDIFYRSVYSYDDLLYTPKHKDECKRKLTENGHFIYNGKVIGEFVCDRIQEITYTQIYNFGRYKDVCEAETRLDFYALDDYLKQKNGYGWHISDLVIYDEPRELSEFEGLRKTKFGYEPIKITKPPQSLCYVEVLP